MHFDTIVSYTTRPKREYETDGKEHWFIDEKEAQRILTSQSIVAYTEIGEYKYFVTKPMLEDESKNLYVIDPKGIQYLLENFSNLREYVIIYVKPNEYIRVNRAKSRPGYDEKTFNERETAEDEQFKLFENELVEEFRKKYNVETYITCNNSDINDTVSSLKSMIMETCVHNVMYLICGRTCSGKDTLCKEIINTFNRKVEE